MLRFFEPGLGIKRWLLVCGGGLFILSLGLAYLMRFLGLTSLLPLQGSLVVYVLILLSGFLLMSVGIWGVARSLGSILTPHNRPITLLQALSRHHLERGPRVVAIGGGTGLSTLLRGLKDQTGNLIAIVTVADDGGSSGRLRKELGVLPPGDIRNCLIALSGSESLLAQLFEYRFSEGSSLAGHSFGNLFIVAMSEVTGGFAEAVRASSRVLAVEGEILPGTLANVTLSAQMEDDTIIRGESSITKAGGHITSLSLDPPDVLALPRAVQAILEADLVVLGPGSLYTSVLPNILVTGIGDALRATKALKIYVCNVATQPGETTGYSASDHLSGLVNHAGKDIVDSMLVNTNVDLSIDSPQSTRLVSLDDIVDSMVPVFGADVVNLAFPLRHDPAKLAGALMDIYDGTRNLVRHVNPDSKHPPYSLRTS